jgi:homocysteine S-methyltransferase
MLYSRGISFDRCFDELNLSNPAIVQEIHREYIRAGAEMIETNTFGANRFKLADHGLESKVREINLRGVKIAREVREIAGESVYVLGSVGPIGHLVESLGKVSYDDARAAFKEQIEALLEGARMQSSSKRSPISKNCRLRSLPRAKSHTICRSSRKCPLPTMKIR